MPSFSDLVFETGLAARSLGDYMRGGALRLGVTGLSRAGKTIFITALVHDLLRLATAARARNPFPVLRVAAEGRLVRASLDPQPDDAVPRFLYEDHLASLTGGSQGSEARRWPQSTQRISELRLTIEFERAVGWRKGPAALTLDIVDYPGEWLLDLPLLAKTYPQWARETLEASASAARAPLAAAWRGFLSGLDPAGPASEETARRAAELFTAYLRACREDPHSLSTLPPGRFLMPGDLEGSPALTFAPIDWPEGFQAQSGSLAAMMERRYEAYKRHVVRPFFRDHFARLDRQIVLIDALAALNAGPAAVRDLENALADVLAAFRAGRSGLLSSLVRPRVDRILFAATKADHLHHTSHDRLEAILRRIAARAIARVEGVGARVDVAAIAAVRATREAAVKDGRDTLEAVVGTPLAGETLDGESFDGLKELAIFPGELPSDPSLVFRSSASDGARDYRFVRFRPPVIAAGAEGTLGPFPHIRLDRALQFLLGDRLA
ncbi:MAG TPA: YcjX family protein [Beijerinckiaceae bacterium]|nr:YcjX family protein [Beijerinckiaceae bacterium]